MHFIHKVLCFEEFLHKVALFFKNLIFPDFWLIELVTRPIEIAIKNFVWICPFWLVLYCCWINWRHFWSIENHIESFLKPWVFTCSITIQTFSKLFLSHFDLSRIQSSILCHFPSNFLQGFCFLRPVRLFCPSFFIYFHVSCIFPCILGKISNLWEFGIFVDFNQFFQN